MKQALVSNGASPLVLPFDAGRAGAGELGWLVPNHRLREAAHALPLVAVYAPRFAAPRFALVGDAAVGMHPVTAHGYNFGLYGAEVLAHEVGRAKRLRHDLGELKALLPYEAEHRRATLPIYLGTNAIVQLCTDDRAAAAAGARRRAACGGPAANAAGGHHTSAHRRRRGITARQALDR